MKNHALITGGAGFIGSSLAKDLLSRDWEVTIVDDLSTGLRDNIPFGSNFIDSDISILGWTNELPPSINFVFHLAAQSSGEISFENPSRDCQINVVGTLELLHWALSNNVKRLIFASSMNVYGDVDDAPVNEEHRLSPQSFYGVGKVACETYIKIYSKLGLNASIFRLFNVYGPGQNITNMRQGMLSIYCSYVWKNQTILVKGSEERYRDFVYIDDVVKVFSMSANSTCRYELLNLCRGERLTIRSALQIIKNTFGKPNYPHIVLEGTPGDQFGIYGDNSALLNAYNYVPETSLTSGLQKMVSWINTLPKNSINA